MCNGIKADSGIHANVNAFKLVFGSGEKKPLYHLRILKELAHLIKNLVIFNKSSKLDQITEGQQVCNCHKQGEKKLDNLDLNSMQSFGRKFEAKNKART